LKLLQHRFVWLLTKCRGCPFFYTMHRHPQTHSLSLTALQSDYDKLLVSFTTALQQIKQVYYSTWLGVKDD